MRPLANLSAPTSLFGYPMPQWAQDTVNNLITDVWAEHHDIKIREKYGNSTVEEYTKGFFANSMSDAVTAAMIYYADDVIPDGVATSDSYVAGTVQNSTANCTLTYGTEAQYDQIKNNILNSPTPLYSLIFYNCQHWAADKFL